MATKMKKSWILLLFMTCIFSGICKNDYLTPKDKALNKLVRLVIQKNYVKNLEQNFLYKIQSGLIMSNRAIFEELLTESKIENTAAIIREFDKLEKTFAKDIKKSFKEKVDFYQMIIDLNKKVYAQFYTRGEIIDLVKFYSSPTGKKFLKVSSKMIKATEEENQKLIYPLSLEVAQEAQEKMQKKIMNLFDEALKNE
jgi:hypothetical protein